MVWPQLVHCVNSSIQFSFTITNLRLHNHYHPLSTISLPITHSDLLILATTGNFPLQVGHLWFRVATPGSSVTPTSWTPELRIAPQAVRCQTSARQSAKVLSAAAATPSGCSSGPHRRTAMWCPQLVVFFSTGTSRTSLW